ncbi:MAG: hypothetical protein ACK4RK_15470 [Gemmataceae bacterium]
MPALHLATFACDVTPPMGHPLCGGWILPARAVDDPLRALGVILLGMGKPVVLCAVDWCGLRNDANRLWRTALAAAAHTVPENVAVQCVHPHNAPFADVEAEKLIAAAPEPTSSLDLKFFERVVQDSAKAAQAALARAVPFTHIGHGQAKVEQVASNRRVIGPDGKVQFTRTSATRNPEARAKPEGLIDPWLRTVSFWDGPKPLAALHYYATHPMSYYGDGRVSCDFCGLARDQRQQDDPNVFQVYFTGCAGNVTAGKYNDGSHENRPVLRDRVYSAMTAAWKATEKQPISGWQWRVVSLSLPPRKEASFSEAESQKVLLDPKQHTARRNNAAFQIAWLRRLDRPIDLTCLDMGKVMIVHLPGEPFIEYQLKAQELRPDQFVCVAGYGDGGPGYIPTNQAFFEGGYEPTVALAAPSEERMVRKLAAVMAAKREK